MKTTDIGEIWDHRGPGETLGGIARQAATIGINIRACIPYLAILTTLFLLSLALAALTLGD